MFFCGVSPPSSLAALQLEQTFSPIHCPIMITLELTIFSCFRQLLYGSRLFKVTRQAQVCSVVDVLLTGGWLHFLSTSGRTSWSGRSCPAIDQIDYA